MADIRIIPGKGIIQFTGSSEQVAFVSGSDESLTFSSTASIDLNADSGVTVSGSFILSSSTSNPFVIHMDKVAGDSDKFKINSEGIVVLGQPQSTPTAVEGGIYYSSSHFYFGDSD